MAPASSLRSRIAAAAAALGLLLGTACSGSKKNSAAASSSIGGIAGNITYVRIPVVKDSNGVPTGLETNPANFKTLPARGIAVRAYEYDTTNGQWRVKQTAFTDANGHYTMAVPAGDQYFVQVESFAFPFGSDHVYLTADPNGLASTLRWAQRPLYFVRASPDGVAATPSTLLPSSDIAAGSSHTANFAIDLTTSWMVADLETGSDGSVQNLATAGFEGSPTGSRIPAIFDTMYAFSNLYGTPTPGAPMELHYLMGRSEPQGTYLEYDQVHWVQPGGEDLAFDSGVDLLFGSIRGAAANDDAWDEAVLFQLFGRASIYRQEASFGFGVYPYRIAPIGTPAVDNLSPDMALQEGLPLIMAANYLQSPYLADTDGTSGLVSVTDIRDLSGVAPADQGPYSPRTLAAMLWEIGLKAKGITSPGTATDWATLNPKSIQRLFTLALPDSTAINTPANIYLQLSKLQQAKTASEPTDLAAIFNDTVINAVTSPFNIPWPQPSTTAFGQSWTSTTSGTYVYSGTLSMAKDTVQVNGAYPNASYQELAYLTIPQVTDQTYNMTLATTPSTLPAGASVQVIFFTGTTTQAYTYSGSSASPIVLTLQGNGNTSAPVEYPIMVRLLSPSTSQPDIPFTLQLTPAANGTIRGSVPLR